MGIEILLQQQMTKIHREQPLSGRVIGITVDRGRRLVTSTKTKTMNIRARKGVIVATGGCAGNPMFRTMFDVRLTEEYQAENSEWTKRTADGEIAAMEIGASLGATACQTTQDDNLHHQGPHGQEEQRHRDRALPDQPAFLPRHARSGSPSRTIRT